MKIHSCKYSVMPSPPISTVLNFPVNVEAACLVLPEHSRRKTECGDSTLSGVGGDGRLPPADGL